VANARGLPCQPAWPRKTYGSSLPILAQNDTPRLAKLPVKQLLLLDWMQRVGVEKRGVRGVSFGESGLPGGLCLAAAHVEPLATFR